jgi:hypothetical protein
MDRSDLDPSGSNLSERARVQCPNPHPRATIDPTRAMFPTRSRPRPRHSIPGTPGRAPAGTRMSPPVTAPWQVCGIVLSTRPRGNAISVWVRHDHHEDPRYMHDYEVPPPCPDRTPRRKSAARESERGE